MFYKLFVILNNIYFLFIKKPNLIILDFYYVIKNLKSEINYKF